MKRLLICWLFSALTFAQNGSQQNFPGAPLQFSGVPSGTCNATQLAINTSNGDWYDCPSGSWVRAGTGGLALSNVRAFSIVGRNAAFMNDATDSTATHIAINGQFSYVTKTAISSLRLLLRGIYNSAGNETNNPNALIWRMSIEYPLGTTPVQFTVDGQTTWVQQPGSNILTDAVGLSIPANATFYIHVYQRVPSPPTSPSVVTNASAGLLSTSTTYFYKVTEVDNGIESGPTAEFSVASSTFTSLALSWTALANGTPSLYRIYRSTTTGTETFIAQIPAPATAWIDTGYGNVTSTTAAPTQPLMVMGSGIPTGASLDNKGNFSDKTATTGQLTNLGPFASSIVGAFEVLGNDTTSHPIVGLGDSIMSNVGILAVAPAPYLWVADWFDVGFTNGTYNSLNLGLPSGQENKTCTTGNSSSARLAALNYATNGYIVDEMGTNDLFSAAISWTTLANCKIQIAQQAQFLGIKTYVTTLLPRTTSTDNWLTLANQTPVGGSPETNRTTFNNWVRNGFQVSAGTPCSTVACGTPSPYIAGSFDFASAMGEVNAAGVATNNGGYWPVPSSPQFTGLILSGSPTTTSFVVTTTPFTINLYGGMIVKMTSGAQNNGTASISSATSTSALTLFAAGPLGGGVGLAGAPVATDTFNVYATNTIDGIHPSYTGNTTAGAVFATWVTANLAP